jgi:hypothetical protein
MSNSIHSVQTQTHQVQKEQSVQPPKTEQQRNTPRDVVEISESAKQAQNRNG